MTDDDAVFRSTANETEWVKPAKRKPRGRPKKEATVESSAVDVIAPTVVLAPVIKADDPPEEKPRALKLEKKTEPEEAVRDVPAADPNSPNTILGLPDEFFSDTEKSYISMRQAELMEGMAKKKHCKPFVDEIVRCDIEIRRIDRRIVELERRYGDDIAKAVANTRPLREQRAKLMEAMTVAMERLGVLPKDYVQEDENSAPLADIHARYKIALDRRRKAADPIGKLTKEASELALSVGMNPDHYQSTEALSDADRDEISKKLDVEAPR